MAGSQVVPPFPQTHLPTSAEGDTEHNDAQRARARSSCPTAGPVLSSRFVCITAPGPRRVVHRRPRGGHSAALALRSAARPRTCRPPTHGPKHRGRCRSAPRTVVCGAAGVDVRGHTDTGARGGARGQWWGRSGRCCGRRGAPTRTGSRRSDSERPHADEAHPQKEVLDGPQAERCEHRDAIFGIGAVRGEYPQVSVMDGDDIEYVGRDDVIQPPLPPAYGRSNTSLGARLAGRGSGANRRAPMHTRVLRLAAAFGVARTGERQVGLPRAPRGRHMRRHSVSICSCSGAESRGQVLWSSSQRSSVPHTGYSPR